ncbi:MAG: fibronectin type III domain-containing protein [Clostridia bacterium]|nr:fibronectin type III domain-containing protein [Clostridia bacterium]
MKRILSFVLVLVLLLSMFAGLQVTAAAAGGKQASALKQGETFYMGRWPQSRVTNASLLANLNKLSVSLYSYNFKHNTNQTVDMSFGDVAYGGEVYRKVVLNQYRPYGASYSSSSYNSYQDDNGYTAGKTYWFRWDPIKWRTLKAESDGTYVMSDLLLDSQPYNDIYKSITWAESTIRAWLAKNFYQSAFSAGEKAKIVNHYHQNENSPWNSSVSGGAATTDKVWLLSYSDTINPAYGFSSFYSAYDNDTARQAQGSAYAKAQGLCVSSGSYPGNSCWWLRSPGNYSDSAASVDCGGSAYSNDYVSYTDEGVRPAFKINPSSILSGSADPAEVGRIYRGFTPPVLTAKISGLKCTARTAAAEKVVWNKMQGATGYQVQVSNAAGNKWAKYYTLAAKYNYCVFQKLAGGSNYKFRVRYFVKAENGKNYFGPWSKTLASPTLPASSYFTAVKTPEKKAFGVAWKAVKNISGYQIQTATNAKFFGTGTISYNIKASSRSAIFKSGIKSGKVYYARIRTYKVVGGKLYFSPWSKAVSVKTK